MNIDTVIFYTNDIKAIISFYKNTLAFKYEYGKDRYSSFIFDNNIRLGIKQEEVAKEIPGSQTVIIKTKKIEDLYNDFKSKDIQITKHLIKKDWGITFSVLDLDGNKIEFIEG